MYSGLVHLHSGLRWIALILILIAIVNAATKMNGSKEFTSKDKRWNLLAMTGVHIQLIIGLVLYVMSPKVAFVKGVMDDKLLRFFTVEHISVMLIGIVLITIGYSRSKRQNGAGAKFKTTFWFYLIGLVVILSRIPWPGTYGAGWG
ncbi:MAG: cytochrome B [Bacteroidota bacterium]